MLHAPSHYRRRLTLRLIEIILDLSLPLYCFACLINASFPDEVARWNLLFRLFFMMS